MTRFRSFWNNPTEAAKKEVKAPITATINRTFSLFSKSTEQRIIRKTPETTNVAAWIRAETGVGPSMASGSQICKESWADLPTTPQNKRKEIIVRTWKSKPIKTIFLSITQGTKAKTVK